MDLTRRASDPELLDEGVEPDEALRGVVEAGVLAEGVAGAEPDRAVERGMVVEGTDQRGAGQNHRGDQ